MHAKPINVGLQTVPLSNITQIWKNEGKSGPRTISCFKERNRFMFRQFLEHFSGKDHYAHAKPINVGLQTVPLSNIPQIWKNEGKNGPRTISCLKERQYPESSAVFGKFIEEREFCGCKTHQCRITHRPLEQYPPNLEKWRKKWS